MSDKLLEVQRVISRMPFHKDKKGGHGKYLTLRALLDQVIPVLNDHEVSLIQLVRAASDGGILVTELHNNGKLLATSEMPLIMGQTKTAMTLGSAITYARRYSLLILLGIMPDDDDDGAATATPKPVTNAFK